MGTLYVVATPIGNLSDISKRALDILNTVDLIAVEDTRQTIKLLNHYNIKTKMSSYHKFNENSKSVNLIEKLLNGFDIALVSDAGTPCISDPGYILVKQAREKGIDVIGIAGPSALVTALSISGINTDKFTFIGFLPTDNSKLKKELDLVSDSSVNTFIFYESPKRIVKLIEILSLEFPNSNVSICSDLTKLHEKNFFGNINEVLKTMKEDAKIDKGEYTIIFEKNKEKVVEELEISIEALLVDIIIKNNCSMKDAIGMLNKNNKNLNKKDIYNSSLNLKGIMK